MSVVDRIRASRSPHPAPADAPPALAGPGAPWGPGVLEAWSRLQAADAAVADVTTRVDAALEALARLEAATVGVTLDLDADLDTQLAQRHATAVDDAARIDAARAVVDLLRRTLDAARTRVVDARRGVLSAQAADLRARYAAGVVDLARHEARTRDLLEQLHAHDGVTYAPTDSGTHHGELRVLRLPEGAARRGALDALRTQVWILDLVAAGQPRPEFLSSGQISASTLPATVVGEHALFPDHPTVLNAFPLEAQMLALPPR